MPIQLHGNFPVVIAKIAGNDVPLIFDLGDASALVLSPGVIDRVKTLPTNEMHRSKDAMGNVIQSGKFKLPRLQIGSAIFTDVIGRPDLHSSAYQATDVGQQGYFGTSLLKAYKVVLDYKHLKMTLIPAGSTKSGSDMCGGIAVPFLPDWKGEPVTRASTDFGEVTAVWDTGAPASILRNARARQRSDPGPTETTITQHFILGGEEFGPIKLDVAEFTEPAGADMFIGYNFFAEHVVCIDFPGHRFLIQH